LLKLADSSIYDKKWNDESKWNQVVKIICYCIWYKLFVYFY
jgi:hypothetical protein